jgi:hypothetical protein
VPTGTTKPFTCALCAGPLRQPAPWGSLKVNNVVGPPVVSTVRPSDATTVSELAPAPAGSDSRVADSAMEMDPVSRNAAAAILMSRERRRVMASAHQR